jgi:hypothetical protein
VTSLLRARPDEPRRRFTVTRARRANVPQAGLSAGRPRIVAETSQADSAGLVPVTRSFQAKGHEVVQAGAELSIRSADNHRACGNGSSEQGSLGGIAPLSSDAVGQHLRRDEDRRLCQDREIQRIAGPGIH